MTKTDPTPSGTMAAVPAVLLAHHLKQLKLPTILREHEKVAREAARDGLDHVRYLLRLVELELLDRERRVVERRIREARFPAVKSFDTFDFAAIPGLNKMLVLELARCEYVARRENVIALGNSGTGKTHAALALGLAACQRGFSTLFVTAHALSSQLMEARDEKRLLKLQAQLQNVKLLIVDELGYVPLSQVGAELLFEVFSQRYERGSIIVTSNLPFEEWPTVFRAPHRRAAGSANSPCPHSRDERRKLSPQAIRRTAQTRQRGAKHAPRRRPGRCRRSSAGRSGRSQQPTVLSLLQLPSRSGRSLATAP